jgi:hypothetical protein
VAKGFTNLFFGDLTGWKADDEVKKHWTARDWVLHYDGKAEGKDKLLRTEKAYGDRECIVDFRFPGKKGGKPAPCDFILRDEKDGAMKLTITPEGKINVEMRALGPPAGGIKELVAAEGDGKGFKPGGQWNRLHATLKGKSARVTLNGVLVTEYPSGLQSANGALALSPQGEMDFANIFVRELK